MKRFFFRLLFKLVTYRPPAIPVPAAGARLTEMTVVNPGSERRAGQTLLIEGERIARLAPVADLPLDGPVDYRGGFVLPGLIDMHVHLPPPARELTLLLFLAHGVTAVREAGDADGTAWEVRRRLQAGRLPGPRLFLCGAVLDGDPPFLPTSYALRTPAQARRAVAEMAARGADFIKIHHRLSLPVLTALRQAAAEKDLRVIGHIPGAVSFAAAGVWDVQHLDGLVPYPGPGETLLANLKKWRDLDPARLADYVRVSVEQGRVHTPTLVTGRSFLWLAEPAPAVEAALPWLPRYFRDGAWSRAYSPLLARFPPEALAILRALDQRSQEVVYRLYQAGVRLHLGTDTPAMPLVVPGLSAQQELRLLVEAGLPLAAAWQAGTAAAGQTLGLPHLGRLQPGAPADLLIFERDPTRDLAALSSLRAVMAQGRLYSKEFLDQALARHQASFSEPRYDGFSTWLIRQGMRGFKPPG